MLLNVDWKFLQSNTEKIAHILSRDIPNYDLRKKTDREGLKTEPHFLVG